MTRYHNINGEKIAFTAEEETARDKQEANALAEQAASQHKMDRVYYGTKTYPKLPEQFDQLFRDITAGKFGDDAKTGEWYIAIKAVKDANPKPS
jgi:hypothetical protein|tara:strand:- start:876 stop:1157 length:282 start_codon:yes stop_codon:yes gene_type:complete